jgi:uncharacterized alpha-E superfamily protein
MPATAPETPDVFLAAISELETEIASLKDRYHQVHTAEAARAELLERRNVVKARGRSAANHQELKEIAHKLSDLENILESQLMTMEPFWTAVRFGGLGLLIGWGLKAWLS